jgi:hypothetical protein
LTASLKKNIKGPRQVSTIVSIYLEAMTHQAIPKSTLNKLFDLEKEADNAELRLLKALKKKISIHNIKVLT